MFVSRKNRALIHFVAGEMAPGLDIAEPVHKRIERSAASGAPRILLEPFSKSCIESLALGLRHHPGLLDQGLFGAKSDILHTNIVYTDFVRSAICPVICH